MYEHRSAWEVALAAFLSGSFLTLFRSFGCLSGFGGLIGFSKRGLGCNSPYKSARQAVSSCNASSRLHLLFRMAMISPHMTLSASRSSDKLTLRRLLSDGCLFMAKLKNLSSNFLKIWRWAAWQRTKALRKTCWVLDSQSADRRTFSIDNSGVSSNKAPRSWASDRMTLCVFASVISWYCFWDMRICQGM